MFPLLRLRLQAFRIRILDRTIRRLSRRNQVLAAVVGWYLARRAAQKLVWRGRLAPGAGLVITMREAGDGTDARPG